MRQSPTSTSGPPTRRQFLRAAGALTGLAAGQACRLLPGGRARVRVGILHSLSGDMAISESPLRDAEIMAIEEINAAGGLLGRPVEAVVEDASSDPARFATQAEVLLRDERVCSVFGGWTSASRKAMLPVFARYGGLLWYPLQYEGNECADCVFYGGATPNQQIQPAVSWLLNRHHRRFYLVGSDYIFPRTANRIIRAQLNGTGAQVAGEQYVPLGGSDFTAIIADIRRQAPDVIFSTINGDSNLYFFRQLARAGITPAQLPVMMVSVAECEVREIGVDVTAGHYACWNYFQSVDTPANRRFVARFQARYGPYRVTDDPIESAYSQVHLWAEAVRKAGSIEPRAIRVAAPGREFQSPGGGIRIDDHNHHTWKPVHVGQINAAGQFDILYSSPGQLEPVPWSKALYPERTCELS